MNLMQTFSKVRVQRLKIWKEKSELRQTMRLLSILIVLFASYVRNGWNLVESREPFPKAQFSSKP